MREIDFYAPFWHGLLGLKLQNKYSVDLNPKLAHPIVVRPDLLLIEHQLTVFDIRFETTILLGDQPLVIGPNQPTLA